MAVQESNELIARYRLAKQVALQEINTLSGKIFALFWCFDTFGNDAQVELGRQFNDAVEYMPRECINTDHCHEALIYLQVIDIEVAQITEAGVAGAKVVDRDHYPHFMQRLEQLAGDIRGFDQLALGQLKDQDHLA